MHITIIVNGFKQMSIEKNLASVFCWGKPIFRNIHPLGGDPWRDRRRLLLRGFPSTLPESAASKASVEHVTRHAWAGSKTSRVGALWLGRRCHGRGTAARSTCWWASSWWLAWVTCEKNLLCFSKTSISK